MTGTTHEAAATALTDADILTLAREAGEGKREALERLRVAVAEALGWTDCKEQYRPVEKRIALVGFPPTANHASIVYQGRVLPNWPNDIAAAFELGEEAKKRGKAREFADAAWQVIESLDEVGAFSERDKMLALLQAGPIERCAAFLIACRGEARG